MTRKMPFGAFVHLQRAIFADLITPLSPLTLRVTSKDFLVKQKIHTFTKFGKALT